MKTLAIKITPILLTAYLITACGGGGGGGGSNGSAPKAEAGDNFLASRNTSVTLDGSASSDPDGDTLSYTWTQTEGPDVTSGAGTLSGETPSFTAPEMVDTLVFELTVNDGNGNTNKDSVSVNVLEDVDAAIFVDGDNGDDTNGNGTMENPYASIFQAISSVTTGKEDIYVLTKTADAIYDESGFDLRPRSGTSLYGGYDSDWNRDVKTNKTLVYTNHSGFRFSTIRDETWVSGFDLETTDSPSATDDIYGIYAIGSDSSVPIYIHDNIITTGNVEAGKDQSPGSNYGLAMGRFAVATINNNTITVGTAGDGDDGNTGDDGDDGDAGENGTQNGGFRASGGSGGDGGDGGAGGTRGGGPGGNGGSGSTGGSGTQPLTGATIAGGSSGSGGSGGASNNGSSGNSGSTGGRGVPGASGSGTGGGTSTLFRVGTGFSGSRGGYGSGGGGGGGGEATIAGVVGGGGGGGGEGGQGGASGRSGIGGGASIGIWLYRTTTSSIDNNTITANNGGTGGRGGIGGEGGVGGAGGSGSAGDTVLGGSGGNGATGGRGGAGGRGGYGGSGGGGPSFGISFGDDMAPTITNNIISSANGGNGGNSYTRGNAGEGGYSYALYDRDTADSSVATLDNNTLSFGSPGLGGTGGGSDGATAGSIGRIGEKNF